jgi:hypothetical protein
MPRSPLLKTLKYLVAGCATGAAAWAVFAFTRPALGNWRFLPVTLLGLATFVLLITAVIFAALVEGPRWLLRTGWVLYWTLVPCWMVGYPCIAVYRLLSMHATTPHVLQFCFGSVVYLGVLRTLWRERSRGRRERRGSTEIAAAEGGQAEGA